MSAETTFQRVKEEIVSLIQCKPQVTSSTPRGISGIYLLYVDNFSDDKVLPIYIGQTTDFKVRLRQHISDISKINDIPYHEYHNSFFWGAKQYDGHVRPCKIFKYMVEHHCLLTDLRMIVLEECDRDLLREREQFYLSKYLPAFLGFNQINTIAERWILREKPKEYAECQKADAELFATYFGFGFTQFNYLHAFKNNPYNKQKAELDTHFDTDRFSELMRAEKTEQLAPFVKAYNKAYQQAEPAIVSLFAASIHEIFEQCKLKSSGREEEVLSLLLNNSEAREAGDIIRIKEYLEYYMDRNKNSRKCGDLLRALFAERIDEIREINAPVKKAYLKYLAFRKEIFLHSRFSLVFPDIAYLDAPLGAKEKE